MAERNTAKSKRPERAASPSKNGAAKSAGGKADGMKADGMKSGASKSASAKPPVAKVDGTEAAVAENARLRAELAEARERIADLELRQTEITNRIAWVIDSLHNIPE